MSSSSKLLESLVKDGRTNYLPPLVSVEKNSRSTLLIDSSDRLSGNSFDFVCDLQSNVPRARYVRLKKVIVPKLNNVNAGNNTFRIKHAGGTTGVITLTPGLYNTTTIANELTTQINAAFVAAAIVDTVTVSFNTITRAFTITSVGANNMFIIDDGDLITFGQYLIPFESEPEANAPSASVIYSGVAAMLSCRYFIITSQGMTKYQYGRSIISSSTRQTSDVVGIIDVSDVYVWADWDVGVPFKGVYSTLEVEGEPISVMNSQDQMERYLDFKILDGFKRDIGTLYNLTAPYPTTTTLSIVMVFEIIF